MTLTHDQKVALVAQRWRGRRVAAAMSGGVDSSVTAALLKEAGCDVVGITMKLWDYAAVGGDQKKDGSCCTLEAFMDARSVCEKMGIPHYAIDLTEAFESTVIRYFVDEYRRGRTPNPCVICNIEIKWAALWRKAREIGCEAIATGHYACLDHEGQGDVVVRRGFDASRDQTYFLWGVPLEHFTHTIFPLGPLLKTEVRKLAADYGLINAEKAESRDICFVADDDLPRFLSERAARDGSSTTPGSFIDKHGNVVGEHHGFESLTVGQRRGLGISFGKRQYVTDIDASSAAVVLGDDADLWRKSCEVGALNWLVDLSSGSFDAMVQIRYRHEASPARVTLAGKSCEVTFSVAQRAITPGQSAVFYDTRNERLLGGGVIEFVPRN
jgi:tRNA-specific 2-thiouridylase